MTTIDEIRKAEQIREEDRTERRKTIRAVVKIVAAVLLVAGALTTCAEREKTRRLEHFHRCMAGCDALEVLSGVEQCNWLCVQLI